MPPRRKKSAPTPVDATVHADKRLNVPTADAQAFLDPVKAEALPAAFERDPSVDPQLVWRGKDLASTDDLIVEAPPIFIHEKIDPRVLIEGLRAPNGDGARGAEFTLFDSFDGLDPLDIVDFYRHQANWSNRLILGDSLHVMASLAEREGLREQVQTIYIDPPYGIRFQSNWQLSARDKTVKDGQLAHASREPEVVRAFRDTWVDGVHSYLTYLRDRMVVARPLLASTGSIFVQIGDENVHRVRALMDEVFGPENFVSQIAFRTKMPLGARLLPNIYDHLLWYAKDLSTMKFRPLFTPKPAGPDTLFDRIELADGSRRKLQTDDIDDDGALPEGARLYRLIDMSSAGLTPSCVFDVELDGAVRKPTQGKSWKTNPEGMGRLLKANRVVAQGKSLGYVFYHDDYPYQALTNVWTDTRAASRRRYVVQTSDTVIARCLLMTTDPGDLVLDPTCGAGTTAFVAEQWGRRWISIDSSRVALTVARERLMSSSFPYYRLSQSSDGAEQQDPGRGGFVLKKVPHVTLGSIARNIEIDGAAEGDITAIIASDTDYEQLVDQPEVDPSRVRVSGPFTVEALAPPSSSTEEVQTGRAGLDDDAEFLAMVLSNLERAGVENGEKTGRLLLGPLEPCASPHLQAVSAGDDQDSADRVAVAVGPRFGTVGPGFVKKAAQAAIAAGDVGTLLILGFAFDPVIVDSEGEADDFGVETTRALGPLKVVIVRMNADLQFGDALKPDEASNLFMVFGKPDIHVSQNGDDVVVILRGVDVFDPAADAIRSCSTDQIAMWMIDTNYNGESFFVRHCYFTGADEPYKKLARTLRAEVDEEAWASLYRTESRPFPLPETGKIAVKVINDYGDEVMQVFDVPSGT